MNLKTNIIITLIGGLLLGIPWLVPPLFFLIFIAWTPLLWLERQTQKAADPYAIFNYALISFLVWNLLGTWWVARAQLTGAILIMAANSLLQAFVFWLASRTGALLKISFIPPFVFLWLGYEHFHLSWDLAWPWLNVGNSLATAPQLIQWYEFTGVRGGSLWILAANLAVLKAYAVYRKKGFRSMGPMGAMTLILLAGPALISYQLYHTFRQEGETVNIALIQPNLDPYIEKFEPQNYDRHLEEFYRRADEICDDQTQYLFGPETLIVEQIDEDTPRASKYYRQLLKFRQKYPKLNILIGIHSYQKLNAGDIPPGSRFNRKEKFYYEAFNTALFLAPGQGPQFYHKAKLVPLFERMPFVQYLRFLGKYSLELGGYNGTYSPRQESTVFTVPGDSIKIVPIVCFESIFGPYCARNLPAEKGFIAMITNDGWWKSTPGYQHHFNFSPVRAIENRRDMVRVANTGISAVINAKGLVVARTPWWEKTTLKGKVHLHQGRTFFARHGDYLGRFAFGLALILIFSAAIRKWFRFGYRC